MTTSEREEKGGNGTPRFVGRLLMACKVAIEIAGLMTLTRNKIHWTWVFADVVQFYRATISQPVADALSYIADQLDVDLSWVPAWFPDYLPIASVFSFSLLLALAHVNGKSQIQLYREFLGELFLALREDFAETIAGVVLGSILLAVLFLTAPLFVIAFPLLLVLAWVTILGLGILMWIGILGFIARYILPFIALGLAIAAIAAWVLSRDNFINFLSSCRHRLPQAMRKLRAAWREGWKETRAEIAAELPEARSGVRAGLASYGRLILTQYRIAFVMIVVFLTAVVANSFLQPQ